MPAPIISPINTSNEIKIHLEFNGNVKKKDHKLYLALIEALRQIVK